MAKELYHFSQSNILYGPDDARKQKALDAFFASHADNIMHVFGVEKGLGIDDIHEIHRRSYISGGQRVQAFLLWRADEMTREATQALLKLFEEPPVSSVFFLLSRSLALPETLLSRASRFGFFDEQDGEDAEVDGMGFFTSEIMKYKAELESQVRSTHKVTGDAMKRLSMLVNLSAMSERTKISPKYLIDSYNLSF